MALPQLASAGAQVIGGLFGNRSRKREARRQRQWSEDMWNRQNAYNTPVNQMQRLKDAGLNPALMYGQGNVGNAEKAMQYQQPQIENVGAGVAQGVAAGAQADIANSVKKLNEANASLAGIQGAVKAGEFEIAKDMAKYQKNNLAADTELKLQNVVNQDTVNKLNKEYLKLEKQGYHKGNLPATLLKSVFGLDITTDAGREMAQLLIGTFVGSQIFQNLTGGVKNIFQAFKPSVKVNKTIGEQYINK